MNDSKTIEVAKNTQNKYKEGFNKGFMQLRQCDVKQARAELSEALGINNEVSFRNYRYGRLEVKAIQADRVTAVFNKYGINEIWGKYNRR